MGTLLLIIHIAASFFLILVVLLQAGRGGGMESNHHGVAPASPSSWCVYQFRHHRKQRADICTHHIFLSVY